MRARVCDTAICMWRRERGDREREGLTVTDTEEKRRERKYISQMVTNAPEEAEQIRTAVAKLKKGQFRVVKQLLLTETK